MSTTLLRRERLHARTQARLDRCGECGDAHPVACAEVDLIDLSATADQRLRLRDVHESDLPARGRRVALGVDQRADRERGPTRAARDSQRVADLERELARERGGDRDPPRRAERGGELDLRPLQRGAVRLDRKAHGGEEVGPDQLEEVVLPAFERDLRAYEWPGRLDSGNGDQPGEHAVGQARSATAQGQVGIAAHRRDSALKGAERVSIEDLNREHRGDAQRHTEHREKVERLPARELRGKGGGEVTKHAIRARAGRRADARLRRRARPARCCA